METGNYTEIDGTCALPSKQKRGKILQEQRNKMGNVFVVFKGYHKVLLQDGMIRRKIA